MQGRFTRMSGSDGQGTMARTLHTTLNQIETIGESLGRTVTASLKRVQFPFKAPSLIDRARPYFSGIKRFGVSKVANFWHDPFHTLLNQPWGRFIGVFFITYFMEYFLFAFLYWFQGSKCVYGLDGKFSHALWVSSRTASTLGFDQIRPNPDCPLINLTVITQVIAASLINFIMLGVVFARFSAPFKRATTVRFSKVACVNRHPSGFWCISLRVANLRKHQILQPTIRMVVTAVDSITPSNYIHEQLAIEGQYKQLTNLELGFPAQLVHVITPDSFLYNLSLLEMDTRMMEVLVFVDGIDAMTSKHMSARIAYSTTDMLLNEQFVPMNLEMRGKQLGLDFNNFDRTVPHLDATTLLEDLPQLPHSYSAGGADGAAGPQPALWQLRHQTFKRLAERYAHLGEAHAAAAAAAAAASAAVTDAAIVGPVAGAGSGWSGGGAAGTPGPLGAPPGTFSLHDDDDALHHRGGSGDGDLEQHEIVEDHSDSSRLLLQPRAAAADHRQPLLGGGEQPPAQVQPWLDFGSPVQQAPHAEVGPFPAPTIPASQLSRGMPFAVMRADQQRDIALAAGATPPLAPTSVPMASGHSQAGAELTGLQPTGNPFITAPPHDPHPLLPTSFAPPAAGSHGGAGLGPLAGGNGLSAGGAAAGAHQFALPASTFTLESEPPVKP